MRNYKSATINNRIAVDVFEMSVAQVLALLFTCNDLTLPADIETFNNIIGYRILHDPTFVRFAKPEQINKLTDDEQKTVIGFFYDVNQAFFKAVKQPKQEQSNQGKQDKPLKIAVVYQNLLREIEVYTRWGHPNILNYGWSYFVTVQANFDKWTKK